MTTMQTDDWWDRLYAEAETVTTKPTPPPRAAVGRVQGRLPDWWAEKPEDLTAADPDAEDQADDVTHDDTDADADAEDQDQDQTDTEPEPDGEPEPTAKSGWFVPQAGYWPTPNLPTLPAKAALSDGTKRLLYNVSAAGAGYYVGLAPTIGDLIESCGQEASIGGALTLGGGICLGIAALWDRRTRHWKPGLLAWIARIPLASALTALALYAPASQI